MSDPNSLRAYEQAIDTLGALHAQLSAEQETTPAALRDEYADLIERVTAMRGRARGILALRQRAKYGPTGSAG
jgi:hypothetical protein